MSSTVAACAARCCGGRENVHKRYLIHVAGFNLGILMRALFGSGTPREAASAKSTLLFVIQLDAALAIAIVANIEGKPAMLVIIVASRNRLINERLHHRADKATSRRTGLLERA